PAQIESKCWVASPFSVTSMNPAQALLPPVPPEVEPLDVAEVVVASPPAPPVPVPVLVAVLADVVVAAVPPVPVLPVPVLAESPVPPHAREVSAATGMKRSAIVRIPASYRRTHW